ncbi:MAG: aminopeptidase P N-terminal domain-containing protein [Saprospiraceae bacterium]|nr:aminopeptidase P N-terminal domain-containing protein [Saprospiraceae bacterium]
MRDHPIDPSLFIHNRARLTEAMPPGALAIFHSNDIPPTNADGTGPFVQNSNLFWLTGIDQEETILMLFPDAPVPEQREMLFVRKTNKQIAIWEGHKYTKEEATATSGIQSVHWLSSFESLLKKLMSETDLVFLSTSYHAKQSIEVPDRNHRFVHWCKEHFPLHQYRNAAPIVHNLRLVKSPIEIDLIRTACEITEAGFRRVLSFVKPGVWEYEIEAEYAHAFIRRRARGFAYEPIIGAGDNSCVLHYVANNQQCQDGQVLLMDVGACYANYASDMTRTIPVNGRFTARQRAVYEAVLRCFKGARDLLKAGTLPMDYDEHVELLVEKELVDLGLITMEEIRDQDPKQPVLKKYFMHKTAHAIGLDVHDVGDRYRAFEPGMVFTCEPGIYIPAEGIGIRLENDILITGDGNEDLMADIPIEPDEIEDLMQA